MDFRYYMPTEVLFGKNCVWEKKEVFKSYGRKALVVTGRHSAKACGALEDISKAFEDQGISWVVFDEVENNPSVQTVEKAAELGRKENIDFVIGIGGGSPLDASKAISVLCAEKEKSALDLFQNNYENRLPLLAIPTTSGTGSEVTQYSVLYREDLGTKVSFSTPKTFPDVALLDPGYTYQLKKNITVNTAIDAFTHCLEGFLARRSTPVTDSLAMQGISIFGEVLPKLKTFELSEEDRGRMMYMSMLGGMTIANAGVTAAHGMGYCYTCFHDIPHGLANGLLMEAYLDYNKEAAGEKIQKAMELLGFVDVESFILSLKELTGETPGLQPEDIEKYTELTLLQKGSLGNNPQEIGKEELLKLWEKTSH